MERLERTLGDLEQETRRLSEEVGQLLDWLEQQRQAHVEERTALEAQVKELKEKLSFYASIDSVLSEGISAPIKQALELARAVGERAQQEARNMIREAELERERILAAAQPQPPQERPAAAAQPAAPPQQAAQFAEPAPGAGVQMERLPEPQLEQPQPERQTELIVTGLRSFGQLIALQRALHTLPEVTPVKLRYVQRGTLTAELIHSAELELAERLRSLSGLDLRLVSQAAGSLRFELPDDEES